MTLDNSSDKKLQKADIITSIIIFLFGIYVLVSGIYMSFYDVTGTKVWYYSPGMYPITLGAVLVILSVILFVKNFHNGFEIYNENSDKKMEIIKRAYLFRLLIAIVLFAIYVFVLFGHLPFILSTFLYLSVTMTTFKQKGFSFWKIILISLMTSSIVYLFFGIIAAVPLS